MTKGERLWGGGTHLELLLELDRRSGEDESVTWTAPRWMTQGDLLFFYHTKTARQKIARLQSEVDEIARSLDLGTACGGFESNDANRRTMTEVARLLGRATKLSDKFSGSILACAEVTGPSAYHDDEDLERHFSSRSFAPLGRVRVFERPLPSDEFVGLVKIGQGTPNTPLYEEQFNGIKRLLSKHNDLPDFLRGARIAEEGFRDVTAENWPSIAQNRIHPPQRTLETGDLPTNISTNRSLTASR